MHASALAGMIVELVASIEAGALSLAAATQGTPGGHTAPGTPAPAGSAAGYALGEEGPQQG